MPIYKRTQTTKRAREEAQTAPAETAEKNDVLEKDIDEILDEIDDVLEENATEFVANYVQKGGQ